MFQVLFERFELVRLTARFLGALGVLGASKFLALVLSNIVTVKI